MMTLYATPLSHFSRKVRILLDLYAVDYEFIDIGNVAEGDLKTFAGNPLLKVPVLVDGETWIIESDHIARYVAQKFDPADRFRVTASGLDDLNLRAVLNGIMTEEVKVILARRTGVPVEQYRFFADALEAIANGLMWLETNAGRFTPGEPGYREFHLVCLFQHLEWYELLPLNYPKLRSIVEETVRRVPVLVKTAPLTVKPKG
ncbi:MAG TPA: glutathione S-transferase [Bdellovibrionales bacterium]|nr:glutathione S-transferase [Bdellovibrionales bacterium]